MAREAEAKRHRQESGSGRCHDNRLIDYHEAQCPGSDRNGLSGPRRTDRQTLYAATYAQDCPATPF